MGAEFATLAAGRENGEMGMKKPKLKLNQTVVNSVILVLIFGLFLYLGVQLSQGFSSSVTTQRTQVITDVDYLHLRGYVFRNEAVIERPYTGVCHYLVDDGKKVGKDQSFATYYKAGSDAAEKQAQLDELSSQIALLNSKTATGGSVSDLAHIEETLSSSYYSYVDSVLDGNFRAADRAGEGLLGSLVNRSVITEGREDIVKNVIKPLENKRDQLLSTLGAGKTLSADGRSFHFFHSVDGYEEIFSSDKLDGLTPEELEGLISASPKTYEAGTVGKKAFTNQWFLVIPADEATMMRFVYVKNSTESETDTDTEVVTDPETETEEALPEFNTGVSYKVSFSEVGSEITMVLDRVYFDGEGDGYLVFSSYDLILSSELARAQDVKITMGSTTGYRIPSDALEKLGEETGVYILVGTVVEFRRVTVSFEGNGYCVVKTYEADRAEGEKNGTLDTEKYPYLYVNDLIITSGNDLYDGKLLD